MTDDDGASQVVPLSWEQARSVAVLLRHGAADITGLHDLEADLTAFVERRGPTTTAAAMATAAANAALDVATAAAASERDDRAADVALEAQSR